MCVHLHACVTRTRDFLHVNISANVTGSAVCPNNDTPSTSPQQLSARRLWRWNANGAPGEAGRPHRTGTRRLGADRRLAQHAEEKERPPRAASGLRIPVATTSVSCLCGFTHFYTSTADTTVIGDKRAQRVARSRFLPEHNCFHSIPRRGRDSGSFPRALFYQQGFPPLIAFVALPSYIPLHFSPPCLSRWGEAVMLCTVDEKGAPPPGIVGPLVSNSQQPVTNRGYAINTERWLAEGPRQKRGGPITFHCDGAHTITLILVLFTYLITYYSFYKFLCLQNTTWKNMSRVTFDDYYCIVFGKSNLTHRIVVIRIFLNVIKFLVIMGYLAQYVYLHFSRSICLVFILIWFHSVNDST